jgi:type III secretion protein S
MNTGAVVDASYTVLMLVLVLSLPAVLASATVGLLVAIAQAVTQIQDQGVAQALKLIAVFIALALSSKWIATSIYHTADRLFASVGFGGADAL